ncbi:distal tail protein Dit [Latilactobacillus curvatus]|uniref:distal tail protein Dit n=1 Tax=Latilactobacillus curvatus TaxID=28038 RepID=UPI0021A33C4A|nr:distal tail protein Dit [Latilactobacillus curvatus]MCT3526483.1 phage tail family protein [Latilactobacillus curvatus]MDG2985995.1 phage tail family protein [Latilactobacillus curvatus]
MIEISLKVIFNDADLSQWITVTKGFTRGIRGEKDITTTNVGNSNGSILLSERYLEKTISMPFVVLKLTLKKQRELSAVLNVDEPKRLIFGDDPDKYYMAMPAQSVDFEELRTYGRGTIDWLCLDPFAYGKDEKTFTNVGNMITIENSGTYPTPVSFSIESQSDNGFVDLVNSQSIIEVGNPAEIDGHAYSKSERLINEGWGTGIGASWKLNQGYIWGRTNEGYHQGGTMTTAEVPPSEGGFVYHRTATTGWGAEQGWTGPSLYQQLPKDSNGVVGADNWEFYAYGRARAETVSDVGIQEYNLTDKDGNHVAGVRFVKNGQTNKSVTVICYVGEQMIWHAQDKRWDVFTGVCDIKKMGNTFSFVIHNLNSGASETINWIEANVKPVTGVTYWNGKYQITGKSTAVMPMYNMVMQFTKLNVDKWSDDPNTFKIGDLIRIDANDNVIRTYLNNVMVLDLQDIGSRPIIAPPGESVITIAQSDFAKIPKVTARIRERWL